MRRPGIERFLRVPMSFGYEGLSVAPIDLAKQVWNIFGEGLEDLELQL